MWCARLFWCPLVAQSDLSGSVVQRFREGYRLHHLSQQTVCQNHCRHPVLIGFVECQCNHIDHFLYGGRCKYENMEVTMSHCVGCLIIVRLCRLNRTQTRAATLHVDDNIPAGRNLPCRRCPLPSAKSPGEEEDVMARTPVEAAPSTMLMAAISDSACKKTPPAFSMLLCHIRRQFGLRCDRIPKETLTAGPNRRFCQVPRCPSSDFFPRWLRPSFTFESGIAQSGHIIAHIAQLIHAS